MGGRTMEWVGGLYAAVAALAAQPGRAPRRPGELVDVSLAEVANTTGTCRRPHGLAARPPEPGRAGPQLRDAVDRADVRRLGRVQHEHPHQFDGFLLMIERPDLIEDGYWASIAHRVMNWDEWNGIVHAWTTEAHDRRDHGAGGRAAHAGRAGVRRPRGGRARPGRGARLWSTTPPARSGCPAGRGASTARARPRPRPRRASVSTPARSCPVRPRPPATRDAHAAAARPAGARPHRLVGGPVGDGDARRARRRRDPRRVGTRPDGMRLRRRQHRPRQLVGLSPFFHIQHEQARPRPRPRATEGRELALRLIEQCDVVVENFTPRVLEKFGLDWDVVHAANPRAVLVRMPAFGLDGPWRDRPGFAQTMEQVTGLAWITGHADDQPRIQRGPVRPQRRHARGRRRAGRARAARPDRRRIAGRGGDVRRRAQHRGRADHRVDRLRQLARARGQPQPVGRAAGRVRDRHAGALAGGVGGDRRAVAGAGRRARPARLGDRPALAHPRRPAGRARPARREARRLGGRHRPRRGGRPAARRGRPGRTGVRRPPHVGAPAVRGPRLLRDLDHPVAGAQAHPSLPFRFAGVDRWVRTPAPMLGQHNDEILTDCSASPPTSSPTSRPTGVIGTTPSACEP